MSLELQALATKGAAGKAEARGATGEAETEAAAGEAEAMAAAGTRRARQCWATGIRFWMLESRTSLNHQIAPFGGTPGGSLKAPAHFLGGEDGLPPF